MVSKIWFGNHVRGHVHRHARGHVHSHARGISVLLPFCFRFASVMLVKLIVKTRAASRGAPLQLILAPGFFEMLHIYIYIYVYRRAAKEDQQQVNQGEIISAPLGVGNQVTERGRKHNHWWADSNTIAKQENNKTNKSNIIWHQMQASRAKSHRWRYRGN